MSTKNVGNPMQGRRLKGGNSGQEPIEIKASIGDGTTAGSATPLLKFSGTTQSTTDGDNNITTGTVTGSAGSPNKAILVSVAAQQTSGVLVSGKVYKIISLKGADAFTNIHSGSTDYDGLVFTATGTTPTDWTEGSVLENTQQYWIPIYATA
jgi:hypothetical protein